jgi:histidyl-tRNA synthetase
MAERFQAPRGTHDILPADQPVWFDTIVATVEELARLYGYRRIQTPTFEDTDLFRRTSGSGSDVVQKEMYTFTDRSDRSLTLRPEGTAPICRAYLEHGMHRDPQPVKLYTLAPMFRYAAPQKGRYREHWQLSLEAIGSRDPAIDAEVIQLYDRLLAALRITDYRLELNSIGDSACRPAYLARLNEWLDANADLLDDEAREKRATSPLRVFDVKSPAVREVLREAPKIGESLCDECREHFGAVRAFLDAYGVEYELEPTLVRGLDYYTRTTWEFVGLEGGAQSTLSGGGRYDGLVEQIGGPPTPAIGFGAGLERLQDAYHEAHDPTAAVDPAGRAAQVFFVVEDGATRAAVLEQMMRLRARGVVCDTDYAGRSVKGQLTQGGRSGAGVLVIAGSEGTRIRQQGEDDESVPLDRIAELLGDTLSS